MNAMEEAERRRLEADRRFEEMMKQPCPSLRPRMVAIEVSLGIRRAMESNPESLRLMCTDDAGVVHVERPFAASGGTKWAYLGSNEEIDVYALVGVGR
jgi:hypothetical protein